MRRLLPVLREALDHWLTHSTPQTAAGLAYYTVFSLAPLLLIAIGIAGIVLGQDQAREQIVRQATSLVGSAGRAAVEGMLGDASEAPKAGLVGTAVGFLTLLLGAVGVLAQLKFALNTVWHVEAPPFSWGGLVEQYLSNMALVVATGFLLLVSLVATAAIGVATARLRSWLAGPGRAVGGARRRRRVRHDRRAVRLDLQDAAGRTGALARRARRRVRDRGAVHRRAPRPGLVTWAARAATRPMPPPRPSSPSLAWVVLLVAARPVRRPSSRMSYAHRYGSRRDAALRPDRSGRSPAARPACVDPQQQEDRGPLADEQAGVLLTRRLQRRRDAHRTDGGPQERVGRQPGRLLLDAPGEAPSVPGALSLA